MSKTNLDDLDLERPGIEADEISVEGATPGQALLAGATSGFWGSVISLVDAEHSSEDTLTSGAAATAMSDTYGEVVGPGWSINGDGDIVASEDLDGMKLVYFLSAGLVTSGGKVGYFTVQLKVQHDGEGIFYTMPVFRAPLDDEAGAYAFGFGVNTIQGGDVFRTAVRMYSTTGGTGDLNVDLGRTILMALR